MAEKVLEIILKEEDFGKRLDKVIIESSMGKLSRCLLQKLFKQSAVKINGVIFNDCSKKVQNPGLVTVEIKEPLYDPGAMPLAENIPLDIVFEDEHLLVINKKSGMVCHPAPGNFSGTLVNALLGYCQKKNLSNCGDLTRPGIVHRLDKDTSGLMIIAKTNEAHLRLASYFSEGKGKLIKRRYKTFTFGIPFANEGEIKTFISRNLTNRQKYTVSEDMGKTAITKFKVLESKFITSTKPISLIECELLTGRTHQIRVHLSHIKCPVIGDPIYGKAKIENVYPEEIRHFPRTALHSFYLEFKHPITKEQLIFESPLPEDLLSLEKLF